MRIQSLGWEDPLQEGMVTHSSILTWRTPWTEMPGGLQSMGLQRVGHDWSNWAHTSMQAESKWKTPGWGKRIHEGCKSRISLVSSMDAVASFKILWKVSNSQIHREPNELTMPEWEPAILVLASLPCDYDTCRCSRSSTLDRCFKLWRGRGEQDSIGQGIGQGNASGKCGHRSGAVSAGRNVGKLKKPVQCKI